MTTLNPYARRDCRLVLPSLLLALLLVPTGCSLSSNRTQELVEARLRQQEDAIRELEGRLRQSHESIAALQQEADSLRLASQQGLQPIPPEQADPTFRVAKIEVSSLMSGGIDRDQAPGDDQFTVLLSPRDASGNTLRVGGDLEIELFDFTRPSDNQRIGHWQINRAKSGDLWHQGLVGTGYQFTSNWQQPPSSSDVHVHARLTTVDGRQFDTTSKLRVTPPQGSPSKSSQSLTFAPPKSVGRASVSKVTQAGWTKSAESASTPAELPADEQPAFLPDE